MFPYLSLILFSTGFGITSEAAIIAPDSDPVIKSKSSGIAILPLSLSGIQYRSLAL